MSIAGCQFESIGMAEAIGNLKATIDTMLEEGAI